MRFNGCYRMKKTFLTVLVCLVIGAGGMWLVSNMRVKFEMVGSGATPTSVVMDKPEVASQAPGKLPEHLLPQAQMSPEVRQAGATQPPAAVGAGAGAPAAGELSEKLAAARTSIEASPIEITELLDGTSTEAILYTGSDLNASTILLRSNSVILNFRFGNQADLLKKTGKDGAKLKLQILATAEGSSKPVVVDALDSASTTASLALTSTEFTGKRKVTLTAQWMDTASTASTDPIPTAFRLSPSRVESKWEVLLPTDPQPKINKVYNGYYADAQTTGINVFPGFARVEVTSKRSGAENTFILYSDTPTKRTVVATATIVATKPGTTAARPNTHSSGTQPSVAPRYCCFERRTRLPTTRSAFRSPSLLLRPFQNGSHWIRIRSRRSSAGWIRLRSSRSTTDFIWRRTRPN